MADFEKAIRDVETRLRARGLGHVFDGVRRIRVVREESFHDCRTFVIGLNPADARKPFAAFHARAYLLLHELGHQFAEACVGPEGRKRLAPLFGDYDRPYRRLPKPRACGADHVSRYAMTHPAEDFAETFAVCLWRGWEPARVDALIGSRSPVCRRKVSAMRRLIGDSAARGPGAAGTPPAEAVRARRFDERKDVFPRRLGLHPVGRADDAPPVRAHGVHQERRLRAHLLRG